MGNAPSGEAPASPGDATPPDPQPQYAPLKTRPSSVKITQPATALAHELSLDEGRGRRRHNHGISPLAKLDKKGMFGQSVIHAVGSGIRYGLIIDMTKTKRKHHQPGKLTLFWSGPLPDECSAPEGKFNRQSRKGRAAKSRDSLETSEGNIHILDVDKMISQYNACRPEQLIRHGADAMHFSGYVEIHLNLVTPISINRPLPDRHLLPPGIQCSPSSKRPGAMNEPSVIYLKDMTTKMAIQSTTSTKGIIESLMTKYDVVDDVTNFALFDCVGNTGGHGGRMLEPDEQPLLLSLVWGPCPTHSLSLQLAPYARKRVGTLIHWDSFTLTELRNFLFMLEKEEMKHIETIEKKYELKRNRLEKQLAKAAHEEQSLAALEDQSITTLEERSIAELPEVQGCSESDA